MLVRRSRGCSRKSWKTRSAIRKSTFSRVSKALLYALVAAAGNVLGGLAVTRRAVRELRVIELLVAFGAGFMLSVAIVELLPAALSRSEEHTSELQSQSNLVCRLLLEKKKKQRRARHT